jgi:hypothetical protein
MIRMPRHQQPGARVRYNYTDDPVPAGTLGTVLGFLGRSQQAQIRWDDDTVSNHTPDEYDAVSRGTGRTVVGAARRSKKTFETYAAEVERALVASDVRPGQADVWISNHGSFIDQNFKRGIPSAETAERILESERHSAIPWVDEARRQQHYRYTDEQVEAMLKNASMWLEPLRAAAKERGMKILSVTPIGKIIAFLRGERSVDEARARRSGRGSIDVAKDASYKGFFIQHLLAGNYSISKSGAHIGYADTVAQAKRVIDLLMDQVDEVHDGRHTVRADRGSTTYAEAKRVVDAAEAESKAAGKVLDTFPKLANGLTPDAVKALPEYKAAKARYNAAFAHERAVNTWFVKNFHKEIRAERASRGR